MRRLLNKENILTLPNLISLFRLLLIPVILWLYCIRQEVLLTMAVIVISGLSDILDGIIARKFNMVSDLGKILDPCADKLTQAAILISLAVRYPAITVLIGLFVFKELVMAAMGWITLKRADKVNSAQWYGKANTVILYTSTAILIVFPQLPYGAVQFLIGLCAFSMLLSLALYVLFYLRQLKHSRNDPPQDRS